MQLLQYAFTIVLVSVVVGAVIAFVFMGLTMVRRTRRLARAAHERGMRFFRDDPYDVPRRYAGSAVISAGHSPRANNVIDGRFNGRPVRAFDFRCELGHGTRRMTRHYAVMAFEADRASEPLLMWQTSEEETPPLAARSPDGQLGRWQYRGNRRLAEALASSCEGLGDAPVSMEVRGTALIAAAAAKGRSPDCSARFRQIEAAARAWAAAIGGSVDSAGSV